MVKCFISARTAGISVSYEKKTKTFILILYHTIIDTCALIFILYIMQKRKFFELLYIPLYTQLNYF